MSVDRFWLCAVHTLHLSPLLHRLDFSVFPLCNSNTITKPSREPTLLRSDRWSGAFVFASHHRFLPKIRILLYEVVKMPMFVIVIKKVLIYCIVVSYSSTISN
jgi:hypothetical protein